MKKALIAILVVISACQQEDILQPLSGAQVQRLLTDGDNKTWLLTDLIIDGTRQPFESCSDTVRWVFDFIKTDSIVGLELRFDSNCALYDTTFLGKLTIPEINGAFSDSLNFTRGTKTYLHPTLLRGSIFSVNYTESGKSISATFTKTTSGLLTRQVAYYLTNGVTPGSSQEWLLNTRYIDGKKQPYLNCDDSLLFVFSRNLQGRVELSELTPNETCTDFSSLYLGVLSIPSSNGIFENKFSFEGGSVTEMEISSFTTQSFAAKYLIDTFAYSITAKKY